MAFKAKTGTYEALRKHKHVELANNMIRSVKNLQRYWKEWYGDMAFKAKTGTYDYYLELDPTNLFKAGLDPANMSRTSKAQLLAWEVSTKLDKQRSATYDLKEIAVRLDIHMAQDEMMEKMLGEMPPLDVFLDTLARSKVQIKSICTKTKKITFKNGYYWDEIILSQLYGVLDELGRPNK